MLKRWNIYLKETYPILPRLILGLLLFFEIYFLVILTNGPFKFNITISEVVGGLTIFSFLLLLRVADDIKDYETDLVLFPERALPAGKLKKKDLFVLVLLTTSVIILLNILFMNNLGYFAFLMVYGTLMSLWFFSKAKIQKSLLLALVTHNPVQLIVNLYAISFACIKYNIPMVTYENFLILFALYFDGLVWEIGRKIRAPKDETEYVTYSKIFGYKKPVKFIMAIMFVDMVFSALLMYELFKSSFILAIIFYIWFVKKCRDFMRDPEKFKIFTILEKYLYITEIIIQILVILFILFNT
jgi:4-hydroxybenzoate polyprenyltransferase